MENKESKEKLYWEIKNLIQNSKVGVKEIREILEELSKQSAKELACIC